MKKLACIIGLSVLANICMAQEYLTYVGRRSMNVVSNSSLVIKTIQPGGILTPAVAYCAYAAAGAGTVTFTATVGGQAYSLGAVAITNRAVIQLPTIWLRADQDDLLTVTSSGPTNLLVNIDFKK